MRQPSWSLRARGAGVAHVPFARGTGIRAEARIAQLLRRVVVRLGGHLRRPSFGNQRSCSRIPDCAMR